MRARNLKPGFFKNEELAKMPYEARLLFIGLWCLADREGRLEYRPERIKAEVFPYDRVNVPKLIDVITSRGMSLHYTANSKQYIHIVNFKKHQAPHPHEAKSLLPPPNGDVTLNPDVRNPDVRNPYSLATPVPATPDFAKVWQAYPRRKGRKAAERHFKSTVKTAVDFQNILRALENYKRSKEVKEGFVQNGSTWFNDWESWIEGDNNASHGSEGVSEYAAIAERARASTGLRKVTAEPERSVLARFRDLPDVQSEDKSGS